MEMTPNREQVLLTITSARARLEKAESEFELASAKHIVVVGKNYLAKAEIKLANSFPEDLEVNNSELELAKAKLEKDTAYLEALELQFANPENFM